jgi:hypothetical protein
METKTKKTKKTKTRAWERKVQRKAQRKAQAAIFDGITFLLMTGFACALVYSTITGYGDSMDNALYSFYELNYLQSAVKSLYYIHLNQLAGIGDEGLKAYQTAPALGPGGLHPCSDFASYLGSQTVLDLLKKDLSDSPSDAAFEGVRLDDKFWNTPGTNGVPAPGKQALRCALKELMKPLVLAGYDYYAEIICPKCHRAAGAGDYKAIDVEDARVTSSKSLSDPGVISKAVLGDGGGCLYAQTPPLSYKVLTMDVPLRISLGTSCTQAQQSQTQGGCQRNYILRVCVWQKI